MKADELFALASAHSIDLTAVAGNASDIFGIAARRPRNSEERRERRPVRETVEGKESRVIKPRMWTHAELAQALGGLERMPTLAAFYSFEQDDKNTDELFRGLLSVALKMADTERWPVRIAMNGDNTPYGYIARITALVLDVDRHRPYFTAAPTLFVAYMSVNDLVWYSKLARCYLGLHNWYDGWLDAARGYVNRALVSEWRRYTENVVTVEPRTVVSPIVA